MKKSTRFSIVISAIALAAVCILSILIFPPVRDAIEQANAAKALQKATHALTLALAGQEDGALTDGTVIKVKSRAFIFTEEQLMAAGNVPDTSAAITMASTDDGAMVYLLPEDGGDGKYRAADGITYEKLIDPDDGTIETYTYTQVNRAAQKFLDEVSYDGAEDDVSEIAKYLDDSGRYDVPAGCTVPLKAGELTVYDNGTKNAYTVTVRKGAYTFYNITPGVGGEFYVQKGSKIVQKGHLRPTGTLRMIYSDTPGLQNMRDLGGWPCDGGTIKYNLLIRGGMVIDAADWDRNTWVKLLGIEHDVFVKTYDDSQLIGKDEYRMKSPFGDHITLYQMDLSAEDSENKRNFADAKEQMNGIINHIFDAAIAGETTYFHCLAGADRTGMVAIVVEGVLGVSKGDIDRDYELTSFNCLRERNSAGYQADIRILERYPGTNFRDKCVQYLLDCGITLEKINAFRKAVIDGDPEAIAEAGSDINPTGTNLCVPGGDGWIDNGRCSSTGDDRYDAEGYTLTNYFAVQNGDTVYVRNLHLSDTLFSGLYRMDKSPISGFTMTDSTGTGFVKDIRTEGNWELFTVDHTDAGYMRLCGVRVINKAEVEIYILRAGEWLKSGE
ncbi:MAG: tyrosine-protein phosphatase [Clostridia bacterium]|nr:tyrosine-protein phosphatase [Clostridia bacterium]